jgi:GntR family transcriptional regulator/MocR family aminotransferase
MIELGNDIDEQAVLAAAARRSIRVYGLRAYRARPLAAQPGLVVGYGGLPESSIREAVRQLTEALAECGAPRRQARA